MITESLFKSCMGSLKGMRSLEDKLYELGIDTIDVVELQELEMSLVNLLCYSCKDKREDEYSSNNIECFLFEGALFIVRADGEKIEIKTVDDLWKYFVELHPEIEDKEKSEWV